MTVKIRLKVVNSLIVAQPKFISPHAPNSTIMIKGFVNLGSKASKLDQLLDVIENSSAETGDTLVYDKTTDKYTVKPSDLDAGDF